MRKWTSEPDIFDEQGRLRCHAFEMHLVLICFVKIFYWCPVNVSNTLFLLIMDKPLCLIITAVR